MKNCSKCLIEKELDCFSKNRNICKLCECKRQLEYKKQKQEVKEKSLLENEQRPEYLEFVKNYSNKIICGDALETMKLFPDKCINSCIFSPPYNLNIRKTFGNTENWNAKWNNSKLQAEGYDQHEDAMPEDEYITWQQNILKECFRLIKDDGCIFYNHKWRVQNGLLQQRPEIIKDLPLRQIIIWKRAGGLNFNSGYFLPTYEVIYLIAKPHFELAPKANAYGDVWEIPQGKGSFHPAPFPEELAARCVNSVIGDIILDPFSGSGTTAVATKKAGKTYIGIDISQSYCDKSIERLLLI